MSPPERAPSPRGARRSLPRARRADGFAAQLLELGEELRREGVAVGTSELLDAFDVLREIDWTSQEDFREALAATLAKSQEDRRIFELVFDRFFFRAVELAAISEGISERRAGRARAAESSTSSPRRSWRRCARRSRPRCERARRERCATSREWRSRPSGQRQDGSGVIGVDVQRIRRALGLRAEPQPDLPPEDPRRDGLPRDALRRFEALLRRELERAQIERTGSLPAGAPAAASSTARCPRDRSPTSPPCTASSRSCAGGWPRRAWQARGHRRHAQVDVRRTMRASLQTGGVPVVLKYRPRRPRRPELYVLCDVSTSVTSASVFFLSVLHALHDTFRKMRSFVFIERISEVTDIFEHERNFKAVSERISSDAGVADISGYTDYGRVWSEFLEQVEDDLDPRATVIVLGDARTNGRDPRADIFAQIAARAGRTFWLNPEPRLYWNYGDSVIAAYEQYCTAFECWTTSQLEDFVRALARPGLALAR